MAAALICRLLPLFSAVVICSALVVLALETYQRYEERRMLNAMCNPRIQALTPARITQQCKELRK